jgi:hypothetical protein
VCGGKWVVMTRTVCGGKWFVMTTDCGGGNCVVMTTDCVWRKVVCYDHGLCVGESGLL